VSVGGISRLRRQNSGLQVALQICVTGEQQVSKQERIMCAVDFSWRSEGAFNYAVALAKSRRAQLDLLFAVSPRTSLSWRARERIAGPAELHRRASAVDVDMTVTVEHGRTWACSASGNAADLPDYWVQQPDALSVEQRARSWRSQRERTRGMPTSTSTRWPLEELTAIGSPGR
jgi:hypothetical protein